MPTVRLGKGVDIPLYAGALGMAFLTILKSELKKPKSRAALKNICLQIFTVIRIANAGDPDFE